MSTNLPNLPTIPEKVVPSTDRVLLMPEPYIPYEQPKGVHLSETDRKHLYNAAVEKKNKETMQKGSLIKAIVLRLPIDLDTSKFAYKVGDIVAIPDERYESISVDRTPLILAGTRDIKSILPDLTEEEVVEWNEKQDIFINEVVYPVLQKDANPKPRMKVNKDGSLN